MGPKSPSLRDDPRLAWNRREDIRLRPFGAAAQRRIRRRIVRKRRLSSLTDSSVDGMPDAFPSTHWSGLIRVREEVDEDKRREALGAILSRYWRPIYCYLRRTGRSVDKAKDLTQGFLHEIVLGRELIEKADAGKGRFRAFLITALNRYVTSMHRHEHRRKRMPDASFVDGERMGWHNVPEPNASATPEQALAYAWAKETLASVMATTEQECRQAGLEKHWALFSAKALQPVVDGADIPTLADLCVKHGISSPRHASNMIITARRRFRSVLRRQVRQFVDVDDEVDAEIRDLVAILSKGGAGS